MRAPGTQGPRPLSKSDEGGPRKGKRASPLKATKLKKSKDKQKNQRLRSPGPSIRKSQSSGTESSSLKEESLVKQSDAVSSAKGHLTEYSPPMKGSPKKRSTSAGSLKALNDVVNDLHLKLESVVKKERGRTPKKSPSKPVKSKLSSSEKSLSGESSSLKFKRSSEKSPSGDRSSPKPKKTLEKSPSRESSLSKKSLEKSISEDCASQKPKKSPEKSPSRESFSSKKSENSISENCSSSKPKKSPEKSSSRESSLSKAKRSPEKVLLDENVPSKPKMYTSEKFQSRESCSPKRNRKASVGDQGKQKETERDLLEAKKQRIAKCIEAVIIRYSREIVSTVTPITSEEVCAKSPLKGKTIKEETKSEDVILKRSRGRPKGSKNKVKKEKDGAKVKEKVKLGKGRKKLSSGKIIESRTEEVVLALGSDPAKVLEDPKSKKKLPKGGLHKPLKKKHNISKKVLSSKAIKAKPLKPKCVKILASPQSKIIPLKERESSESETDCKKSLKGKHKPFKSKVIEENASELDTKVKMKKPLKRKKSSTDPLPKSKGGKSVSFPNSEKPASLKKEVEFFYDFSDQEEDMPRKPLKKALKEKGSHELKKSVKNEGHDGKKGKGVYLGRRREHPHVCYEEESDRESDAEDLYPKKGKKEVRAPGRKRKRKKSVKEDSEEEPPTPAVPRRNTRSPRMASLNAIAMMACMNEDAKVPLPSFSQQETASSMALVVRESTIARRHSGDESEDSEDDSDRGYSPSRRPGKRKPEDDSKDIKAKRRRRRRGELDVTMDMKDMVVRKRMASLNASAIMAASYCSESRTKRNLHHPSGASEVTKISFKATKKQNLKTRSVITVQETTKKVKKAQGDASTEVEEHIIVKKKVRQSGMHVEETPDTDRDATDTDNEILPKSPEDSGVIMESTTITYVTTQTHTVPKTVTLSGVKEYSVSTSNGKTTTMMQQVQRKSVTTTCTTGPPSSTTAIPTALIPPTQHVQVAQEENQNQGSRVPPNYSPLGALEVMRPVMQQHPQPPPPPPAPHFIPYAHTHHVTPVPHPHYHHPAPPPPPVNSHHHMPPHQPSSPYPPLSPHSPPYPPPSSSSSSSPACTSSTSPSTTPHPHPSPSSCHSTVGYRSPVPCSPSFPSPVSSPKQGPPQGVPPSYRDDRPHPSPMSSPNGLVERHSSAFSAPTPTHSPASGTGHGYQPVSGPIPTGGSPNAGAYKPPQGSPGGSSGAQPPPPYSSPSRLTSPPPPPPPNKSHYPPNDHYPGGPHSYQSYPYPGTSPYDKYYPRNPSSYHLYQPSFAGGQYPPGEYGYQPPPSGTVHYSQESYTSYTLCVPAPPPHGSPPNSVTHSSALALPPPPTSNAPHHHPPAPYTTYHCTEYAPVFPYPPPGPSQNAVCCPAGGPKNVSSGPLTGSGKGPESSDCGARKQLPGPSGSNPCNNYQYYGGAPPPKNQNPHMVVPGSSHGSLHHQASSEGHLSQRQHHQGPPHPHQHSYMSQQESMAKDLRHPSFNESSSSLGRSNVPKSQKDKLTQHGNDVVGLAPHTGAPAPAVSVPKPSPGECKEGRNLNTNVKAPTATSAVTLPTTSLSVATTLPSSGVSTTSTLTTSSVSTTFATGASSVKSICSSTISLSIATTSASSAGAPAVSAAPSASTNLTSISNNTPLLAIATSLPLTSPPPPPPPPPPLPDIRASVAPAGAKETLKHGNSNMPATPLPFNSARQARAEEDKNSAKVDTSSASSADGALIPIFPTSSAPLKTTTWVVQPSASSPTQQPSSNPSSRVLHLSPTNTTISVSLSNTNLSTNSVMSTTAPVVASLENVVSTNTTVASEKTTFSVGQGMEKLKEKSGKDLTSKDILIKSSAPSQRAGGRHHLLCQPLPLSHTKVTSVLAKVRPSNAVSTKPMSDDASRNYLSSDLRPGVTDALEMPAINVVKNNLPKNDNVVLPRKRGRPPKSRETGVADGANSNGFEGKHFCRAPGEISAREDNVPRKRMSLLKSSGAKSSLALVPMSSQKKTKLSSFSSENDLQGVKRDSKFAEDMKIDVKPETLGKIKAERVSPKQGSLRDSKMKLLNGDFDIFDSEKALKGTFLQPSLGIENLDQQDLLKRKLKSENDCEDSKGEDKKIPKLGRPPKFFCSRIKLFKTKAGLKPKQRPKASLLAYLKEKNNESDASLGETEPLPPPPHLSMLPVEEDQTQKEEDAKKSPMRSSAFPSYNALSIRGRRASGAGKGKCQRKPKHCHGWSWEGEPHEGKVWLRNDEMWIVRKCYNAMKHKEGDTIRVRDCVLLRSGPRKTDLPFVAKVAALWEDPETCDMMMSILWYYRPEHTESGRREEDLADEIFASKHRDHLSVACIEDRCYVLTFNEYCRYRRLLRLFQERVFPPSSPVPDSDDGYLRKGRQPPGCVVQDLLFFCRKVYDYRQKRILKNPC